MWEAHSRAAILRLIAAPIRSIVASGSRRPRRLIGRQSFAGDGERHLTVERHPA